MAAALELVDPPGCRNSIIYRAWREGDLATAATLNKKLLQLPAIYALETPFVSLIKYSMQCVGLPVETYCLPPILEASEEAKDKVHVLLTDQAYRYRRPRGGARYQLLFPLVRVNFELGVIMVIAVSCVKLLSAHNSTQHTSRKHKV